jgi:hypothetical protein
MVPEGQIERLCDCLGLLASQRAAVGTSEPMLDLGISRSYAVYTTQIPRKVSTDRARIATVWVNLGFECDGQCDDVVPVAMHGGTFWATAETPEETPIRTTTVWHHICRDSRQT